MDLETALARAAELVARERSGTNPPSDEEVHEALSDLRLARKAAPGAKKSRAKAEPVNLDEVFG